jgi:hypothetical protein
MTTDTNTKLRNGDRAVIVSATIRPHYLNGLEVVVERVKVKNAVCRFVQPERAGRFARGINIGMDMLVPVEDAAEAAAEAMEARYDAAVDKSFKRMDLMRAKTATLNSRIAPKRLQGRTVEIIRVKQVRAVVRLIGDPDPRYGTLEHGTIAIETLDPDPV